MPNTTITPVPGARDRYDDDGRIIEDIATCGTCGRSWNDASVSDVTPAPSARCPFEYDHEAPVPSPYDVIGSLVVTDEAGVTWRVSIRREDLTTTNGAYRAIRDEVTETLQRVLAINRETPS